MVFIWGYLQAFSTLTSQKSRISFFHKTPHQAIKLFVVHRQPSHVQTPPNSKLSCTKNFMVFIWGYLQAFSTLTSHKPRISFFHKTPPKPYGNATMHRPTWPSDKPSELKNFVHQEFHSIHLGTLVGLSNPHISKITNFIFSQNSPLSQQCRRAPPTLAICKTLRTQNFRAPRFSCYSFGDICRPFQPSHLKNHEFYFFIKIPNQPI